MLYRIFTSFVAMKIAGFTFIRNAVKNDYPIVEAITSILPICDEFVVAVGRSDDNTLDLVKAISSNKIRIIETIWDEGKREGGRAFADETDKAYKAISPDADWAFYIQGDECVHEKYLPEIKRQMELTLSNPKIEGLLFKYLHFYGSYDFVATSRRWYRKEIRAIKLNSEIRSYRDAQGFRKGDEKIQVKEIDAFIYHYGWVKPPSGLSKKVYNFNQFYDPTAERTERVFSDDEFDYGNADMLNRFTGTHPQVMKNRIEHTNWTFNIDPAKSKRKMSFRRKALQWLEEKTGWRISEYKNYRKVAG